MIIVPSQPFRPSEAPAAAGRPTAAMIAFFSRWRRNKSLLRSSSGPCYPYPRSHSTVMVVPSGRPQEEPPPKKTQQPRRRPPLNRAIPTIPESRSNESIMSHASRVSQSTDTPAVDCVVIENRAAVERLPLGNKQTMRRSVVQKKATTPRSPLLSVAHTVRDKLSKLTKRKATAETSTAGVRSSQSFSGFRAPPPPTPRVDENSNRVIKSSSMEAPLSDRPSTSKVVIPQCPEPLFAEESSEAGEIPLPSPPNPSAPMSASMDPPSSASPPPLSSPSSTEVRVSMKSDVLVVTELSPLTSTEQPTTVIVAERPRELPVSVVYAPEPQQQKNNDGDKENDRPPVETETTVTVTETVVISSPKQKPVEERTKSPERFVMTVKTPEAQRKHRAFVVEERPSEVVEAVEERVEVVEKEVNVEPKEKREDSKSPGRYVLTVRSPEPQRHRVFTVQQKSEEEEEIVVETRGRTDTRRAEEKKTKETKKEETKSPERYVMTVKTPEPLRKHRVLTIAEAPPSESKKMTRSRSEERPTLRIWTNLRKTLALRRTQTFSSASMEQEHKAEEPESQSVERKKRDEEEKKERFVIITKTPQSLRRHHTFMVGDRARSPDVPWIEEGLLTEPIATVGPEKKQKRTRSEEPRKEQQKEEPVERFVMTTRTPLTMRRYQTFVVETKKPVPPLPTSASADVVELERRGDQLLKELDNIYPTSSRLDQKESQEEPVSRISTKDMYVLTSTTPQLRRRDRDEVSSPTLFVLGKRPLERPAEDERRLEAVRECSQSDRAELKSAASGELTSLEEDIPMDTAAEEHVRPVVAVLPLQSRPVPSPKTARKKKKSSVEARLATQPQNQRDHRLLRGLRNAGKIFSPSFLKNRKPPPPSSVSHLFPSYPSLRAPLAEGESSVVANSPMVETLPIETWNTPRPRGSPPRGYAALIREENNDANGNPTTEENGPAPSSPQLLHRGLIDDEILDQPMLVGDSFSHSESSDRLSERAQAVVNGEQPRRPDVSSSVSSPRNEVVDESLAQVAQIKSQLLDLQSLIHEHTPPSESAVQDVAALAQENDSLRRQLVERDKLIDNLRAQLAQLRPVPV